MTFIAFIMFVMSMLLTDGEHHFKVVLAVGVAAVFLAWKTLRQRALTVVTTIVTVGMVMVVLYMAIFAHSSTRVTSGRIKGTACADGHIQQFKNGSTTHLFFIKSRTNAFYSDTLPWVFKAKVDAVGVLHAGHVAVQG